MNYDKKIDEMGEDLMSLTKLTYYMEEFPYLVFYPGGKKNKSIRSINNKVRKESIHRIHTMVEESVQHITQEDVTALQAFLGLQGASVLPLLISKEGDLYLGGLVKPELFLFKTFSNEHGVPIHQEYVFETKINTLSNDKLEPLIQSLINQYIFCAKLAKYSRENWIAYLESRFQSHSLVTFAQSKKEEVQAVEKMNKLNLLSQLKYPEDIAFWRHRVEIVMRPFRSIPMHWLWSSGSTCNHQKDLIVHSEKRVMELHCDICDYQFFFYYEEDALQLNEEFDLEKVRKRVNTIERQFNEIVEKNDSLLDKLKRIRSIQLTLKPFQYKWKSVCDLLEQINKIPKQTGDIPFSPFVEIFTQLNKITIPNHEDESYLLWFSQIELPNVHVLKTIDNWEQLLNQDIGRLLTEYEKQLEEYLEQNKISRQEEFMKVNNHSLYWGEVEQMLQLIHDYAGLYPAHVITQVLIGKTSNKIRTEKLHYTSQFGVLDQWLEKDAMKALKTLEKEGWLQKLSKGFALTDKSIPFVEKAV
ncbi:hypothetical protein GLW08_16700 [Pontibacillus yanchengensis]|uniref:Uncharacterized protein n=1 Tax=Pontibacillus yanchengensis TaxID=462910 RepID=A0ACC7VK31_9BACI|nr:hypothetical protein [Pontibacillus yanchengensis]